LHFGYPNHQYAKSQIELFCITAYVLLLHKFESQFIYRAFICNSFENIIFIVE